MHRSKLIPLACGLLFSLSFIATAAQAQALSPLSGSHSSLPIHSTQTHTPGLPPHSMVEGTLLHLSASATTEVTDDWLVMTLEVQKDGVQAAQLQNQLNAIVAAAILKAKPMVSPGQIELSTGRMNLSPRFDRDSKINGWVGSATLILQGRDASQITALASRMSDLTVSQIQWQLSVDEQKLAETRIQAEAVERFKNKAQSLTQQLGMSRYTLKEISVGSQESVGFTTTRLARMQLESSRAPVPTVAGKTQVVLTLTGTVQLHP